MNRKVPSNRNAKIPRNVPTTKPTKAQALAQSKQVNVNAQARVKKNILLSILIPSVPDRNAQMIDVYKTLQKQILPRFKENVEIITFVDNRQRTTGKKRNDLINLSQGKYVVFVDDDDKVDSTYVRSILDVICTEPDVDCIVFDVLYRRMVDGFEKIARYSKDMTYRNDLNVFHRKPNHLMCFRREIALKVPYPNTSRGEDTKWGELVCPLIKKQARVDKVLYTYEYREKPISHFAK